MKFTVQYFRSKFLAVSRKNLSGDLPSALSGCAPLSPSLNRLGVFLNVRPSIFETERDAQQQWGGFGHKRGSFSIFPLCHNNCKQLKLRLMEQILEINISFSVEVLWFASPQCILKATPNPKRSLVPCCPCEGLIARCILKKDEVTLMGRGPSWFILWGTRRLWSSAPCAHSARANTLSFIK